jgi:hypothetical protein
MMLSAREKLLIALLAVLLVGSGLFFGMRSLFAYQQSLAAQYRVKAGQLERVQAIKTELARLRQPVRSAGRVRSLVSFVEQLASAINLKDRIQLNMLPDDNVSGLQRVDVKIDTLTLDESVGLVYTLENAENPVIIDQLEITPSFRDKELLRLTLRVLAPK